MLTTAVLTRQLMFVSVAIAEWRTSYSYEDH